MSGTEKEPLGQPGGYRNAVVSPDGRFVVAERYPPRSPQSWSRSLSRR